MRQWIASSGSPRALNKMNQKTASTKRHATTVNNSECALALFSYKPHWINNRVYAHVVKVAETQGPDMGHGNAWRVRKQSSLRRQKWCSIGSHRSRKQGRRCQWLASSKMHSREGQQSLQTRCCFVTFNQSGATVSTNSVRKGGWKEKHAAWEEKKLQESLRTHANSMFQRL